MNSPSISVIVPVFNDAKFINDCFSSLLAQTFVSFEVLAVDDGSTDESYNLLLDLAKKDCRIRVLNKDHAGVSDARNLGLKHATGNYVCFVDADDVVESTYLEDLLQAFDESVDSTMGGFDIFGETILEKVYTIPEKEVTSLEKNLYAFYDTRKSCWQHYLWNRMFKMSVILRENLCFNNSLFYKEDGLFVVQYLCHSNGRVGCVNKVLYHYRHNPWGAMSKVSIEFDPLLLTNLYAHYLIIKEIKVQGISKSILDVALNQAKSSCNWIHTLMLQSKKTKLNHYFELEGIMINILGIGQYIIWRLSQLFRITKRHIFQKL